MENEERLLYTIWLNQACGHNPKTVYRILEKFQTPEEAFRANHFDAGFYKILKLARVLTMDRTLESAKRLLERCRKQDILVLEQEDERYPQQLKNLTHAPTLLYAKGNLPDLNRILGISMVGTRNATADGEKAAEMLGRTLAENGVTIVSGMAKGIDGAAHCGALEAGGTTLAVLAGGVDVIYPTEHTDLYRHILDHGGILSEQPPGTRGRAQFYEQRNRIVIGLSYGTVVVEGELRSGTSMSARIATENNRDIFAVPGNPMNKAAALPNELIRDGAKQVLGPLDVLEEYIDLYPERLEYGMTLKKKPVTGRVMELNHPPKEAPTPSKPEEKPGSEELMYQLELMLQKGSFREEEEAILRYLCQRAETVSFDELAENCGIETGLLSSMLIILQMKKAVEQSAGGQYCFQYTETKNT